MKAACSGNARCKTTCCSSCCHTCGGRAGGYLQYIFRTAAKELFGVEVPWDEPLQLKTLRNADFQEVSLEKDGSAVLRFALAYGFRNIQTVVSACHEPPPGLACEP